MMVESNAHENGIHFVMHLGFDKSKQSLIILSKMESLSAIMEPYSRILAKPCYI